MTCALRPSDVYVHTNLTALAALLNRENAYVVAFRIPNVGEEYITASACPRILPWPTDLVGHNLIPSARLIVSRHMRGTGLSAVWE